MDYIILIKQIKRNFRLHYLFLIDGSSTLAGTKILTLVNKIMTKCVTYENNPNIINGEEYYFKRAGKNIPK